MLVNNVESSEKKLNILSTLSDRKMYVIFCYEYFVNKILKFDVQYDFHTIQEG